MQKLLIRLLTVVALLGLPAWSHAQTAITVTTITEPITVTTGGISITLGSATGIEDDIFLLIDNELMQVQRTWTTGVVVPVKRGPRPTTHYDNANVWIFPRGATLTRAPQGSCTRGSGEAVYTLSVVSDTGQLASCRGASGSRMWYITDVSGALGVYSTNPPETP